MAGDGEERPVTVDYEDPGAIGGNGAAEPGRNRPPPPRQAPGARGSGDRPADRGHQPQRRRRGRAGRAPTQQPQPLARPPGPDRGRLPHAVPGPEAPRHELAPHPGADRARHVDLGRHARHQGPHAPRQAVPRPPRPDPHPVRPGGHRPHGGQLLPQRRLRLRHLQAGPARDPPRLRAGQQPPPGDPALGLPHRLRPRLLLPHRDPLGPLALRHQPEHRRRHS